MSCCYTMVVAGYSGLASPIACLDRTRARDECGGFRACWDRLRLAGL